MQLFLREQNRIIAEAYKTGVFTWTESMLSRFNVFEELLVWKDLQLVSLKRLWSKRPPADLAVDVELYTDASSFAAGALLWDPASDKQIFQHCDYFTFDEDSAAQPIHIKEIKALLWGLLVNRIKLANRTVTAWCDNKSVVMAFSHHGGRDLRLSRLMKQIVEFCHQHNITLKVDWKPTHLQKSPKPS